MDPINPGAVDEILNLGTCWKENGFKSHRNAIIHINKEIGETFRRAYRYLGAAKLIHDDWKNYNEAAMNFSNLNKYAEVLKTKLLTEPISNTGYDRHLFATAFTPNGIVTYINELAKKYEKTYVFTGGPGTGKSGILKYLYNEAIKRGLYVEVFHHPLTPDKIEHILIPQLSLAFLSDNEINSNEFNGTKVYMQTFQNSNTLNKNEKAIKESKDTFYTLLNKGLSIISHAKELHDEMEKYYIDNMDFSKLNILTENVINKILGYEKDFKEE